MFRLASARVLLRPPLRAGGRAVFSSQPRESDATEKPDEAEGSLSSGGTGGTGGTGTGGTGTATPRGTEASSLDTSTAHSDDAPTSQETEDKIRAYVASLTERPIPLPPPEETSPGDSGGSGDSGGVKEAEPVVVQAGEPPDAPGSMSSHSTSSRDPTSPQGSTPPPDSTSPRDSTDSTPPPPEEWEQKYAELRKAYNERMASIRANTQRKTTEALQAAAGAVAVVGLKVNEATGYREVEKLKQAVKEREHEISDRRAAVRTAKQAYENAVSTLSSTQSSVNSLLERKHSWTDSDVATFTKLVRADHASRAAVGSTSEALKTAEINVDKSFTALMRAILERYHEEQVWSDKIRSVSTWAQVAILVANIVVFVGAIAFIEPWKRRRLVEGLEERVAGMMDRVEGEIKGLSGSVAALTAGQRVAEDHGVPEWYVPAELAEVAVVDEEEVVSVETAAPTAPTASPLSALAASAPDPTRAAVAWVNTQLGYIAAPSAERDLGAAAVAGALGGVLVVGLGVALKTLARG